ncbi:unnamed protein product [Caenorhabditis brenneri]
MDGWESKYEGVGVYALIVYSISDDFVKEKFFLGVRSIVGPPTAINVGNLLTDLLSVIWFMVCNVQLRFIIFILVENVFRFLDMHVHDHLGTTRIAEWKVT